MFCMETWNLAWWLSNIYLQVWKKQLFLWNIQAPINVGKRCKHYVIFYLYMIKTPDKTSALDFMCFMFSYDSASLERQTICFQQQKSCLFQKYVRLLRCSFPQNNIYRYVRKSTNNHYFQPYISYLTSHILLTVGYMWLN